MGASQHETYVFKDDIDHMTVMCASQYELYGGGASPHKSFIVKHDICHMFIVGASQHESYDVKDDINHMTLWAPVNMKPIFLKMASTT